MVSQLCAHHHILYLHVVAMSPGTAAGDDDVGFKIVNHALGPKGSVHLADTALLYPYTAVAEELLQLAQLLVHSYYNSYFHLFLLFVVQRYKKNSYLCTQ